MIIDAHAHLYPAIAGLGRDAPGARGLPARHPPEALLAMMDGAGVDGAVLQQGPYYGACDDTVAAAVRAHPRRLRGALYLDPWRVARPLPPTAHLAAAKLEFSSATGLCRLRPGARLDDPAIGWVWQAVAELGLTLVVDLGAIDAPSYQTEAMRRIAREHPEMRIVIPHLAQPPRSAALRSAWQSQLDLGLLPNVWFDLASLPAYLPDEGFPWPTAGAWIREACERVGAHKLMWGSDVPGLLAVAPYVRLVDAAREHLAFLPAAEQAWVLGGNADGVYRGEKRVHIDRAGAGCRDPRLNRSG